MDKFINEEINRIQELMYGVINEQAGAFSTKIKNALSNLKFKGTFVDDEINAIRNLRGVDKTQRVLSLKSKLNAQVDRLNKVKQKAKTDLANKTITRTQYNAKIKQADESIAKINKANDEIDIAIRERDSFLKGRNQARMQAKNKALQKKQKQAQKKSGQQNQGTSQTSTTAGTSTAPGGASTTAGAAPAPGGVAPPPVPPPPTNPSSTRKFMDWLKNSMVGKVAKYAAIAGAGAISVALLIKWLKGSSEKNDQCMGNALESRPNKIKLKVSERRNSYYWIVTPDNPAILDISPKIILEDRKGNLKAFNTSGKEIGKWKFEGDCTLYLIYGTQSIPMFTSAATTPSPSPSPAPGPRTSQYTNCSGTYKYLCYSDQIRKLQSCVGVKQDGYWGRNTEAAVKAKFGKNVLTDAEIDQFCRSQSTPQPQPVTPPQPQQPTEVPQTEEF